SGVTSRDVVNRVQRLVKPHKVGHAGTLDPLASGVLVICLGPATRLVEYVQRMPKTYDAIIRLGARSDTDDRVGAITESPTVTPPSLAEVEAALASQIGVIQQTPPRFSAIHIEG